MPAVASSSTPVKCCFSLRFTTPAIASEPYTEDAPPVITSAPSTSAAGIRFTSTVPFGNDGWMRRPFSSTSVRCVPRPRKSRFACPPLGVKLALALADVES